MKKIVIIVACLFIGVNCISQVENSEITIGITNTMKSTILNQDRTIQIYVPEDYHQSNEKYPVIYVFDSQKYFLNAIAYQQNLRFAKETPGFIVVGIKTMNEERAKLYNTESSNFSSYLEIELIPYIDSNYRTLKSERVFFGWQRAAAFGVEVFASKPKLFKAYFIASPTFLTTERISGVRELLDTTPVLNNYLYFTLGEVEVWSLDNTNSLAELLNNKAKDKLSWKYDLFKDENHYSTTIVTMNKGLKSFFSDYAPIRYYSLEEYKNAGGITALNELFEKRGERYQISKDVDSDTKRYLLLLAVRENDFSAFTKLEKDFPTFLTSFSRDNMFERFGQFYVENQAYESAIKYYKIGLQKFPYSAMLYNRLGEAYKLNGKTRESKDAFKKASKMDQSK
jgi:predicted alpha/beta superfamily hydrolase